MRGLPFLEELRPHRIAGPIMTAILTIAIQPPTTADVLRKNPLGIYVTAINWSKELGQ